MSAIRFLPHPSRRRSPRTALCPNLGGRRAGQWQRTRSIFAAIDCHRAAAKANELAQRRADASEAQANKLAADRASDANTAAMLALIATVPTTAAGLRAGLRYVAAKGFEGNDLVEFIRTLLHSRHFSTDTD